MGRRYVCCFHSFKDVVQLPQWALACLCYTSVSLLPSFTSPPPPAFPHCHPRPRHSLSKEVGCLVSSIRWEHRACMCVCCGGGGVRRGASLEGAGKTHTPHALQSIWFLQMFHTSLLWDVPCHEVSLFHTALPTLEDSPVNDEASTLPTDSWAASCQQAQLHPAESSAWTLGCATLHSEPLWSTLGGRQGA